ncbi:MAG: MarR family winged helix-turn-helix transcriptional regulator [Raoultibacter sp.]
MSSSSKDAMRELFEVMQRFRQDRYQTLATPDGITRAEARVTLMVFRAQESGDSPRPTCIAERMHSTPSSLSQTLKTLEEKGIIERHRSSADSRSVSLVLTEKGIGVAHQVQRMFQEHMDAIVEYVGHDDIEHLTRTLKKIIEFHEQQINEACVDTKMPPKE